MFSMHHSTILFLNLYLSFKLVKFDLLEHWTALAEAFEA